MIYECAIDPEFIIALADQGYARSRVLDALKPGKPYIRAGYPEGLEKEVGKLISKNCKGFNRQRIEEVAKRLLLYHSTTRYNTEEWDGSFIKENNRFKFDILLTKESVDHNRNITIGSLLEPNPNPFDLVSNSVKRSSQDMLEHLSPLLKNSSGLITFVDPYFYPVYKQFSIFKSYFDIIYKSDKIRIKEIRNINIISSSKSRNNRYGVLCKEQFYNEFMDSCKLMIPKWIHDRTTVNVYLIYEKDPNDENHQSIHDRFILTDIGGITLSKSIGCDNKNPNEIQRIDVISDHDLRIYKCQYTPQSKYYYWSEPITISS